MPIWLVYVLISVLVMAGAEIAQKIAITSSDNISSETNNFVVWNLQALFSFIVFLLFSNHNTSFPTALIPKLLLLGIVYFWGGTFYYGSFKGSSASLSSILVTVSTVVSTTLGILFFGESANFLKFVGIAFVILGIVITKLARPIKFDKFNLLALAGGSLYGIAFTIDKSFAITINPLFYLPLFCFVTGLFTLVFRSKVVLSEIKRVSFKTFKVMCLSALFGVSFNTFTLLSYTHGGEVGRVDAVNNTVIFFVIALEFLVLKNRTDLKRKIIAGIIAVIGISILALAK